MRASRGHYLARKLFELSGLVPLGAFLVQHLQAAWQLTGPQGAARLDARSVRVQSPELLLAADLALIGLPLLYHAGYGLLVTVRARPNIGAYGLWRNRMFLLQRLTGVIVLLFVADHVYHTRVLPLLHPELPLWQHVDGRAFVSARYLQDHLGSIRFNVRGVWLYAVGVTATVLHFANGVWNLTVHWGIAVTPRSQRLSTMACAMLGLVLLAAGLSAVAAIGASP